MMKKVMGTLVIISLLTIVAVLPESVMAELIPSRIYYCQNPTPRCPQSKSGSFTPAYEGYVGTYLQTADGRYLQKTTLGWTYWDCKTSQGFMLYPGYRAYAGNGTNWSFARVQSGCSPIISASVWEYIEYPGFP